MRGIVAEQSISFGVIEPEYNTGKNMQLKQIKAGSMQGKKFQEVPDQPLYSSFGYRKDGVSWTKNEIILLTTKRFAEFQVKNITKMKVKRIGEVPETTLLKLTIKGMDHFYSFSPHHTYAFFYNLFWAKITSIGILIDKEEDFINSCDGFLVKKSQFLGNWEPRYVLITIKDGLMSHKSKQQPASLVIDQTQELWTRFEIIEGKKYIVFKLWYGIIKQEFGVPIERAVKWCKAFYSLITKEI